MSGFQEYIRHYKSNVTLAYPIVLSQLGHTVVALSDSIIIGHKGAVALAAVSLGNALFSVILVCGIGISYGVTPLIAQANGRSDTTSCAALLKNSVLINGLTGALLFGLAMGCYAVLPHTNLPADVVRQCRPFLFLLGVSAVPLMGFLTFKQFAEGLGYTRQAMVISVAGNLINIGLGIVLVFGWFGLPALGVMGVGLATLTDRVLMAIAMTIFILIYPSFKKYRIQFVNCRHSLPVMIEILKNGLAVSLQYVFEVGAFAASTLLIGYMGAKSLAAHQIALSLASFTYMAVSGIGAAAAIRSGHQKGMGDGMAFYTNGISFYHLTFFVMVATATAFITLRNVLPLLYIRDLAVVTIAAKLLLIAGFFQLCDGAQVTGLGLLRGISDIKIPTLITFFAYWMVGIPSAYLLGVVLKLGPQGVWIGLLIGLFTAAALLYRRFEHLFGAKRALL